MASPIPKGRWISSIEIMEKISEVTRKIARYRMASESLNAKAKKEAVKQEAARQQGDAFVDNAKRLRDQADIKLDKAKNLENGYLQKLKRKLAEMQTELLPMEGNTDASIPKQ